MANFKLKSGNTPLFKQMGSSPMKDVNYTVKTKEGKIKKVTKDEYLKTKKGKTVNTEQISQDEMDEKTSPLTQKDNKTTKTYPKSYTKKDIEFLKEQREDVVRYEDLDEKGKAIWKSQGKPVPKKKKSPMEQKKTRENYLNEGFSQKEADFMFKNQALTGSTMPKAPKAPKKPSSRPPTGRMVSLVSQNPSKRKKTIKLKPEIQKIKK